MKYLLVLAVVLAVLWLARGGKGRGAQRDTTRPPLPTREDMVACSQCGLHLPRSEALPGRGGLFCGEAHRAAYEQAHP